jgi:bifunctional N-acetylglucosamine-1-phosphate-uridyltransferase/glucosamine-1-phosphate-acetyltransferase GlmU-like protein
MAGSVVLGEEHRLSKTLNPMLWTVLVAAAGRGTRLGFDKPKILFPVGGRTILDYLIRLFSPFCSEFVFVLSPEGSPIVKPEIEALTGRTARIAIQSAPRGMGDAVASGVAQVDTPNVVVVWGDQLALRPSSVEFCMRLLQGPEQPAAVCPTLIRNRPYIHFERDNQGTIVRVLQQREGDQMPAEGESDAGVFFFETSALKESLNVLTVSSEAIGRETGEINFLPIFPLMDRTSRKLFTSRIMSEIESVGVNSPDDAAYLEERIASSDTKSLE